jgi:putative ATPase
MMGMTMDLFNHAHRTETGRRPFADAVRPESLDDFFGQSQVVGEHAFLRRAIESDRLGSLILWGPPGVGKTTLAQIIAQRTKRWFEHFSAVLGGVKEIRLIVEAAKERQSLYRRQTILFIDEIHRFNKAQQDALLPHIEDGTLILIGATTENPSFQVNSAVLSRSRVVVLEQLSEDALTALLDRAWHHPIRHERWPDATCVTEVFRQLAHLADGDARRALNALEVALEDGRTIDEELVAQVIDRKILNYDRDGDGHYQVVSAFIKSMRATDPDAAAYWLHRMLDAGEDPMFILRRLVIFASEDIGHADPQALQIAMTAVQAFQFIGLPEGNYALMQATTPKSNTIKRAIGAAQKAVRAHGNLPVPKHLRNAATTLQKSLGDGQGYAYPHDSSRGYNGQRGMPEGLQNLRIFEPGTVGMEVQFTERLAFLRQHSEPSSSDPTDS